MPAEVDRLGFGEPRKKGCRRQRGEESGQLPEVCQLTVEAINVVADRFCHPEPG